MKENTLNTNGSALFQTVRLYYLATPVFLLAELFAGISFRVPYFLSAPSLRYLYYAFCAACGAGCYLRTRATYLIAFAESTFNIVLLVVGFFFAMWTMDAAGNVPHIFTIKGIIGFGITASIWTISFYKGIALTEKKWKPRTSLEATIKSALFSDPSNLSQK
jgi:hypothetical protein